MLSRLEIFENQNTSTTAHQRRNHNLPTSKLGEAASVFLEADYIIR